MLLSVFTEHLSCASYFASTGTKKGKHGQFLSSILEVMPTGLHMQLLWRVTEKAKIKIDSKICGLSNWVDLLR